MGNPEFFKGVNSWLPFVTDGLSFYCFFFNSVFEFSLKVAYFIF